MSLTRAFDYAYDSATRLRKGSDMALPATLFDIQSRFLVWAMKKKPKGSKVLQPRYFELKRERHTITLGWYKDDRSKKLQKEPRDLRQVVSVSIPSREIDGGGT